MDGTHSKFHSAVSDEIPTTLATWRRDEENAKVIDLLLLKIFGAFHRKVSL
jgi:hypothetical protein